MERERERDLSKRITRAMHMHMYTIHTSFRTHIIIILTAGTFLRVVVAKTEERLQIVIRLSCSAAAAAGSVFRTTLYYNPAPSRRRPYIVKLLFDWDVAGSASVGDLNWRTGIVIIN